jgi:hypothetical protein
VVVFLFGPVKAGSSGARRLLQDCRRKSDSKTAVGLKAI